MIRTIDFKHLSEYSGKHYVEAAGLSTDTKPTTNLVTGSLFLEVDTGKVYAFDEISGTWNEIGG